MANALIQYTVLIPHFESLDVLHRAVASVPERKDIEVLIIDNSKEPISPTLFAERKNVSVFYSPYGGGAGTARNVGLDKAQGKWVLLLDADDYFTEDAFLAIDAYKDAEEDIVFFKLTSCYSDDGTPADRHIELNTLKEDGLRYGWASPCGKLIRMELIQEHAIRFETTQAANDVLFSLLTGYYAKSILSDEHVIYCATVHHGSLTQTPSLRNLTDRIEVFVRFNTFINHHAIPKKYRKSIMYYLYIVNKYHGFRAAFRLLWRSIRAGNNPFIGISRWGKTIKNRA